MKPKKVSESMTTLTEIVMPNDTNPLGNLMGGNLMRWMDVAASICAARHCEAPAVTASVDNVSFQKPITLGEIVTLETRVTRAFKTSVEIFVEVFANDIKGGNSRKCNSAYFTFVALDDQTKHPIPVPQVIPLTNEEQELYDGAARRREVRLVLGGRMKPNEASEIRALFGKM